MVDTGAGDGCVGQSQLPGLAGALFRHGLRYIWIARAEDGDVGGCSGVGGGASWVGTILIPAAIAGINGILRMQVVSDSPEQSVPFLFPLTTINQLRMDVSGWRKKVILNQGEWGEAPLEQSDPRQAHLSIDICAYPAGGWNPPRKTPPD